MMTREEIAALDDKGMTAWDSHDTEGFAALFAEDFTYTDDSVPEPMRSTGQVRDYMNAWYTAFPDMRATETNRVIGDDAVAAEVEFTGTNTGPLAMGGQWVPATGRRVTAHGTYFARARDGQITEFHAHPDVAGMMTQLGLIPPPQ
jgi:steroid delta-isomerase-like uncharacterized protein